jgi:hypothetical protein
VRAGRALATIVCFMAPACGKDSAPVVNNYRSHDSAYALATRVVAAVRHGTLTTPCRLGGPEAFSELILVTGRACLSCRGIGNLIRRISRADYPPPLIVFPDADAVEVCPFMAQEHVRNPLVGVREDAFPGEAVGSTVIVAEVDSAGLVHSVMYGRDVTDLAPRIDSLRSGL